MKLSPLLTALACFALAQIPLAAQPGKNTSSAVTIPPEDPDPINDTDTNFIKTTSQGLRFEILAGDLALSHSADPSVKQFGRWMKRDHSADFTTLKALAREEGVPLPPDLSEEQTMELQKLQGLYYGAFDQEYISFEIQDHQMDIQDFTEEVRNGQDFDVKRYASNSITELLEHLYFAKSVGKAIGVQSP